MTLRALLQSGTWRLVAIGAAGILAGMVMVRGGWIVRGEHDVASAAAPGAIPAPVVGLIHREVAVFLGSEACYACLLPAVDERVRIILDSLRQDAATRDMPFSTVGVALDGSATRGVRWLQRYGTFDEVAVGGNWHNVVVQRYVWADPSATAGLPQLVLVRQSILADSARMRINGDSVMHRWLGALAIAPALERKLPAGER